MCTHQPPCPTAQAPDREAAHTVVSHPEQGWSLLCNGVVLFDDTGELLPDGSVIAEFELDDTEEIKRWILAFGETALVVTAIEHGSATPSHPELTALAGVL